MNSWENEISDYLRLKDRSDAIEDLKRYYEQGFRYVVRDVDSIWLSLFSLKPKRYRDLEAWGYVNEYNDAAKPSKGIKNIDIEEINWSNKSPVLISDFIKKNSK